VKGKKDTQRPMTLNLHEPEGVMLVTLFWAYNQGLAWLLKRIT
jgi:hypothetical protein